MTKSAILDAAVRLLWETGFESMSPRKVMTASGVGQGSLYHHFESKEQLALAALTVISTQMLQRAGEIFDPQVAPLERIRSYLWQDRNGLLGCRLGRLANELEILNSPSLRAPLQNYFAQIESYLCLALEQLQNDGKFRSRIDCKNIATLLAASVQGGFLLSRAQADAEEITRSTRGAWALLIAGMTGIDN
jgi:TetR/AcrR family transcriptional regulator, transcriptional repressor for nem operon